MNDDDNQVTPQSTSAGDHHSAKQASAESPLDPALSSQDEGPADASAASDARRDNRTRARILKKLFDEFEIEPGDAASLIAELGSLLPPQHRMSTGEDVAQRLADMIESDDRVRLPLIFTTSGSTRLDPAEDRSFRKNKKLESLLDDEEGLFRALVANERLRGGLSRWLAEHDAMKRVIVTELARRYSLNEQWRYLLPKFVLPVFSVLHAAGVKRDDLRLGSPLLERIIEAIADYVQDGRVSRETLVEAARRTEDQFLDALQEKRAEQPDSGGTPADPDQPEPFEDAEKRLSPITNELRAQARKSDDPEIEARFDAAARLAEWSGGLDRHGRPVFKSLDDFRELLAWLRGNGDLVPPQRLKR